MKKKKSGIHKLDGFKKTEWINPNKMKFESQNKEFNRQTNLISRGNVISNTQTGHFIRPYNTLRNPIGEKVRRGEMQEWDLGWFRGLPDRVADFVRKVGKNKSVILYEFFHRKGNRRIRHGYVVTTNDHNLLEKFYSNYRTKSTSVVDEATKYVAKDWRRID